MNYKKRRLILARAQQRHGDLPTLDQILAAAVDLYPGWQSCRDRLRAILSFDLSEHYRRVRFVRAAAAERGISPALSIRRICRILGQPFSDTAESAR